MSNRVKKIAVIGGGAFGIFASLRLSENPKHQITIFESANCLGGLAASVKYKNHYLDYNTKFIPCNIFTKAGVNDTLEYFLNNSEALLDEIGDYHFLSNRKEIPRPPVLDNVSKIRILKDAFQVLKHFPSIDYHATILKLEKHSEFRRNESLKQMGKRLNLSLFAELISYFGMLFGMTTEGVEAISIAASRNNYITYNYLYQLFTKNKILEKLLLFHSKTDILHVENRVPYQFLMLTTGYDRFLQALPTDRKNIQIRCNQEIINIHETVENSKKTFSVINNMGESFSDYDEIVLALPMHQIQKIKYPYVQHLVKDIHTQRYNYVLSSFCKLETRELKYLKKGIYLDYQNPHHIGLNSVKKNGSLYGAFKHFYADTMFQSLTFVNDLDPESIDENFVHEKWCQLMKELKFEVSRKNVQPYSWKVTKWHSPFIQKGDFDHYEKLQNEQGKEGVWFGGEMMTGPGIPIIIKNVESLFGPFKLMADFK